MRLIKLILSLPYILRKPNFINIINIGVHLQVAQNYLEIFEV
jgi:hypothetical protein